MSTDPLSHDASSGYPFSDLEAKWQDFWLDQGTFRAEDDSDKPKIYLLDMFPYPSGAGLHVGHPEGYVATDIIARYKRMRGYNVLHPMGWDAFGLPTENFAIKTGRHPADITKENVDNFRRQVRSLGFAYDWDREISTADPKYYRWTQWIFRKLYERGLAYQTEVPVNWCPEMGTVLANEEVIDGKSERGGYPVIRLPMRQWVLKITAYAQRLLDDLDLLDWPDSIKAMQRNWIGRSEGAEIEFPLEAPASGSIRVYTTRPDTLFGATYMVLSPEHSLVDAITTDEQRAAVRAYVEASSRKSDLERTELAKEKTGVFTGAYALNPVNGERLPVWIGDYILVTYGTGAIMAVPAHDERDFAFATAFGLPIRRVVASAEEYGAAGFDPAVPVDEPFTQAGVMVQSGPFSGTESAEGKAAVTRWLEGQGTGKGAVHFKLRDWNFSRQRYWGEPFPLLHREDGSVVLLPEEDLPVELPWVDSYQPTGTGESPLAALDEWVQTTDPTTGLPARRETHTMPQWAGSCWYYLRYIDPHNTERPWDPEKERYWMPVDLYVGGAEHAVLHLLYARFWHKVLFDEGLVSTPEPFSRLVNQGLILGEDGEKMSKSRGNVVNPDIVIEEFGADAMRIYEMFMGPLEQVKPWSMSGIHGVKRFLDRTWRVFQRPILDDDAPLDQQKSVHKCVKKVTEDIDGMRFNTAVSALMVLTNELTRAETVHRASLEAFAKLLNPFAPHLAEELWTEALGHAPSVSHTDWPTFEPELVVDDEVEIVVQVNGKVRGRFQAPRDTPEGELETLGLGLDSVRPHTEGKTVRKIIVVPNRIVNIVVGG